MSHTTLSQMLKESHEVVVEVWTSGRPMANFGVLYVYQTQLVCVLLRMREFWRGPLASICIVSHGKGQVTYTRNISLKQLQNGWTMLQILCRTSRQKMRNLKPLGKITPPYDNAQDEKNCVHPHLVMYYGTWPYL
jgi:hypothetical protein